MRWACELVRTRASSSRRAIRHTNTMVPRRRRHPIRYSLRLGLAREARENAKIGHVMCFESPLNGGGEPRGRFLAMSKALRPFVSCPRNTDKEDDASARAPSPRGVQSFVRRSQTDRPLVLIIDDGCEARDLYTAYFEFHGFATQAAEDGFAGIEAALSLVPDAILLDFSMPGMDGGEVLRRIKSDP